MSTIINATTTNGVVIQPDNSGSLVLQTNSGTTALTIDTSQRAAFVAGTAAAPAITTTGDTDTGIFFPAADTIASSTNGTERMRIDSSGNLLVGLTSATANGGILQVSNGITFPATQSAASNANTLDDYEEGTWTPADASGASLSFTSVTATYTKVGKIVTVIAKLTYPSTASASTASISGLPFAAGNIAQFLLANNGTNTNGAGQGLVAATSTTMSFIAQNNAAKTNANLSTLAIYISGTYTV
jgi:hypothetical protein